MCSKICDFHNVITAIAGLLLSIAGVVLSNSAKDSLQDALHGVGHGGGRLLSLTSSIVFDFISVVVLNVISAVIICLSTFEFEYTNTNHSAMRCLTSSAALCFMRVASFFSFLAQLTLTQFFMVAFVMVAFLSYLCSMGEGVVYQAQELVYAIGNQTSSASSVYNPYGEAPVINATDTPVISTQKIISHLNIESFCTRSKGVGSAHASFWIGCLLTVVSQALMTTALQGEKERVSVHEAHEEHDPEHNGYSSGMESGHGHQHAPLTHAHGQH